HPPTTCWSSSRSSTPLSTRCRAIPSPATPLMTRPVFTRVRELDRPLLGVTVALALFGFAALYSAGQTDVPTVATTIWQKQLVWLGVGLLAAVLAYRLSPRMLEWATPYAYTLIVLLL